MKTPSDYPQVASRIPEDLNDRIEQICEAAGISKSALLRIATEKLLADMAELNESIENIRQRVEKLKERSRQVSQ